MKAGIITFHFALNQGAALQCYALQKYLETQGHDVHVIDYRPRYHTVMHAAWRNPFVYSGVFWRKFRNRSAPSRVYLTARSFARCIYWNLTGVDRKSHAVFQTFVRDHLHLTSEYRSLKQLQAEPPRMDAYISGSDQVWNPDLLGQAFDEAYFLKFGADDIRRIAYAVSMGRAHDPATRAGLRALCKGLDAISLREYDEEDIKAIGSDVHICIDPTFLLDVDDYNALESKTAERSPYIFAYGFETSALFHQAVETAVGKYHCRIINGSPKWLRLNGAVENVSNYGPDRFLSLVRHAECVVTNSFHGTAFSIIYQKDFITVPHSSRAKRMEDLLGRLGLSFKLFGRPEFSSERAIEYSEVSQKLSELKLHSKEFLRLALLGYKGKEIPHYDKDTEFHNAGDKKRALSAYYGYFIDSTKLKECASGGVATALSKEIIHAGGAVFGVAFLEDFRTAEYRCVEVESELDQLKGSKYIPPKPTVGGILVYDAVEEKLLQNKPVLFIGSGCHVAALINRLQKKNIDLEKLYTVDLICHGPTTQYAYDSFIESLESKYRSKITYMNMRFNEKGWVPPFLKVVFANGKQYLKPLYETDLGFALRVCLRECCYKCRFKGDGHVSDITIGDYWGLKPGMHEYNKNGVSVMLSRSEKGECLIQALDRNSFFVEKTDVDKVIIHNTMYATSLKKPEYIDTFKSVLKENGLHYAVIHSQGYPAYIRLIIRNRIKKAMGLR